MFPMKGRSEVTNLKSGGNKTIPTTITR